MEFEAEGHKAINISSNIRKDGNCPAGSKNRFNVYNWLSDIPTSDLEKPFPIIEVSFSNGSRKAFFKNNTHHTFKAGELVVVEGVGGFDIGEVSIAGELVKWQLKKKHVGIGDESIKRVLRIPGEHDLELFNHSKSIEKEVLIQSRIITKSQHLEMKITEVEIQADGKKITFYYTADSRVDFRELIKVLATEFKSKIEMRQIGARQENAKIGGIGTCGRELCSSSWLNDFKPVNLNSARYQNLSINLSKLSGQCGKLKCCLNFELDMYVDALKNFPKNAEHIEVAAGKLILQKQDIFRNLMWYSFTGSNKQYPLTIERVKEIQALNAKGEKPEELEVTEVRSFRHAEDADSKADVGFVNDVGQLTLNNLLPKNSRKNRNSKQKERNRQPSDMQGKKSSGNQGIKDSKGSPKQGFNKRKTESVKSVNPPKNRQENTRNQNNANSKLA